MGMTKNNDKHSAIVRDIPNSYQQCVVGFHDKPQINVDLAKQQHQAYCKTLEQLGLKIIRIPADNTLPDCCFTEDTAIVFGDTAIITSPGTASRVAETVEMEKTLTPLKKIFYISPPGTIDGGDVLKIDKKVYIGISARTNEHAIKQVAAIINPKGFEVIGVKIRNILHLKSAVTYVGNGCVLLAEGYVDESAFSEYDKIIVPKEEGYCANCLVVNGKVLLPKGFPKTKSLVEAKGFSVIELEMTEIEKAEGALTCLSVII